MTVNGGPGLGIFAGDRLTTAVVFIVVDALISRIDFNRASAKLWTVQLRSGQS